MTRFVLGVLAGVLALGAVRFAVQPWPEPVHYHANWALFVDGERVDLSDDRYMEEVEACVSGDRLLPTQRVHMHDGLDHVVHVHDEGVTWGHFLTNLGFTLGDGVLVTDTGKRLVSGEEGRLRFVVNGFQVGGVANRLIESGDRLLISYGSESPEAVREKQFPRVADDAEEFNERQDPAGCSGLPEGDVFERLRRAFWG